MHLAVLIGAGASLAEAKSHRANRTRLHPPLDTNFFSKVQEVTRDAPALRRAALRAGLGDPFERERRMEEFFGEVYYEVEAAGGGGNAPAMDLYRTLLRAYMRTLTETTAWFYDRPRGALGRWFRDLIAIPGLEQLTIVTFNHDLVLENVLMQLPRVKHWCVEEGYGPVDLNLARSALNVSRLPVHDSDCDHSIRIELLKLHGSLNWQVATRSHDPSYRDLFPPQGKTIAMECILDRIPNVGLVRRDSRRRFRLWPQIVPPIYGKQSVISGRFSGIWNHASDALRTADRVVVFGYSLPFTDVHTEKMIARCMGANRSVEAVEVINPDPAIARRFAEATGLPRLLWYRDVTDFRAA